MAWRARGDATYSRCRRHRPPDEGAPLIIVPSGIFRGAPNPNAARLFQSFFFGIEAQQLLVDTFSHRSFHAQVKEKPGHTPLSALKLLKQASRHHGHPGRGLLLTRSDIIRARSRCGWSGLRSPACSR